MKPISNLTFSKPTDTFCNYMIESEEIQKATEAEEVPTIDGSIISRAALSAAVLAGKGFMIGGFFVGSDMLYDYAGKL